MKILEWEHGGSVDIFFFKIAFHRNTSCFSQMHVKFGNIIHLESGKFWRILLGLWFDAITLAQLEPVTKVIRNCVALTDYFFVVTAFIGDQEE